MSDPLISTVIDYGADLDQETLGILDITVSGDTQLGGVLTATVGAFSRLGIPVVTYQWYRNGVAISGATYAQHTVRDVDVNNTISCIATVQNGGQSATATSKVLPMITPTTVYLTSADGKILTNPDSPAETFGLVSAV